MLMISRTEKSIRTIQSIDAVTLGFLFSQKNRQLYQSIVDQLERLNYSIIHLQDWSYLKETTNDLPQLFFVEIEQFIEMDVERWRIIESGLKRKKIDLIITGDYHRAGINNIVNLHSRCIVDIFFTPIKQSQLKLLVERHLS